MKTKLCLFSFNCHVQPWLAIYNIMHITHGSFFLNGTSTYACVPRDYLPLLPFYNSNLVRCRKTGEPINSFNVRKNAVLFGQKCELVQHPGQEQEQLDLEERNDINISVSCIQHSNDMGTGGKEEKGTTKNNLETYSGKRKERSRVELMGRSASDCGRQK